MISTALTGRANGPFGRPVAGSTNAAIVARNSSAASFRSSGYRIVVFDALVRRGEGAAWMNVVEVPDGFGSGRRASLWWH